MNYENEIKKIQEYAEDNHIPILRPISSQILTELIKTVKPKNILEIGTATGYSGILMLLSSEKDAFLTTLEKDESRVKIANENFEKLGLCNQVRVIQCDANEEVKKLNEKFDFIFLDGPKSHYIKQLPFLLERLEVNGIIVADNVLFFGETLSGEMPKHKHRTTILRLREFLDAVEADERLDSKLIKIEDGLLIVQKIK